MNKEEAISELQEINREIHKDEYNEANGHMDADQILIEVLKELGMRK